MLFSVLTFFFLPSSATLPLILVYIFYRLYKWCRDLRLRWSKPPSVAIIGSGIGGLCAAIKIKQKVGSTPQIFEANHEVGGTWLTNKYPNCYVDMPNGLYSYSFELNPDWPEYHNRQPIILDYLKKVATKYGLYEQTKFNTRVVRATWIKERNQWELEYQKVWEDLKETVETAYFDFVISALGILRVPNVPEAFRLFDGPIVHTANWDDTVKFENKKVAIVGNGPSASQTVPALQEVCTQLICYQRSPGWVVPKLQFVYPEWSKWLFRWFPVFMKVQRFLIFILFETWFPCFMKDKDSRGAKFAVRNLTNYVKKCCEENGVPELAASLIPDYPYSCKRPMFSNEYIPALCQPNVKVKTGDILSIKGRTIIHSDGSEETVDILVLATGYKVLDNLGPLQIIGRDGVCLNEKWKKESPAAFQALHVHGYPNLYFLGGPNAIPLQSVVTSTEIHVDSIVNAIQHMRRNGLVAMETKMEAQNAWTNRARKDSKGKTVMIQNCTAWWKTTDGEVVVIYPSNITTYWFRTRWINYAKSFIQYKT